MTDPVHGLGNIERWYVSEGDGVPWVVIQDEGGMHNVIAECGERAFAENIARALNDSKGAVAAGDALADAVSDIMADDPESVLHTWARRWRETAHPGGQ